MNGNDAQKLVEKNLGLVGYTLSLMNVRNILRENDRLTYEDLFQEGCLALCNAVLNYDETKGAFSTLAVISIKRQVLCILRKEQGNKRCALSSAASIESDEGPSYIDTVPAGGSFDRLSYGILKDEIISEARNLGSSYEDAARALIYAKEEKITLAKACRELGYTYKKIQKRIEPLKNVLTKRIGLLYT